MTGESVPLKDYIDRRLEGERERTQEEVKRLDQGLRDMDKAKDDALKATEKLSDKHNELIRKGENKEAEFATKDEVGIVREELSGLREAMGKIVGASVMGATVLAILINLILRLAGVGSS